MADETKPETVESLAAKVKELTESNAKLMADLDTATKPPPKEKDLTTRVKEEAEKRDKASGDAKQLEDALTFNLTSEKFINEHKAILPTEMVEIFAVAAKEKYDTAIERANETKSALIQSFFKMQANLDMLTPSQKNAIEDFYKLTKNGKNEKAASVFETIFEPTLNGLKQLKKAEELVKSRQGILDPTDADARYKDKLIKGSRSRHLGEKAQ